MVSFPPQVACFLNSGEEFLIKEDYTQALDLFENALAMAQQNHDLRAESLALQRLGTIHLIQDQPELAIASVEQALALAFEQHDPYVLHNCHRQLAQIQKALQNYEQALKHFEIAESIREEILQNQPHPAIQYAYPALIAGTTQDFPSSCSAIFLLFRTIVERANVGVALFQDGYIVYGNQCFQNWLGYTQTELRQLTLTDLMPPDAYWSALQCHWKRILHQEQGCHCEKQLLCKDGGLIDVEFNANVIDYQHRPAILAFVRDITQRKQVELKLRESEKQFRDLFDHMPIGLYRFRADGLPLAINPAMAHMMGFDSCKAFLEDYAQHTEANRVKWQYYLHQAEQTKGFELRLLRRDGREIWARMCATTITDPEEQGAFFEGSMEDISEIKAAYFALEELAVRDPLTHVYNRRQFFELANREMARASRFNRPLSLVMLDIDYFKAINDQHGHWIGDEVLQATALKLQNNLRQSDILARYGGEEFIILMPETAQSQAWNGAERLRKVVNDVPIQGEKELTVTASFGVTSWVPHPSTSPPRIEELIKQADHALYRAKRAGRNQTLAYSNYQP